jgi:hypothetical protein
MNPKMSSNFSFNKSNKQQLENKMPQIVQSSQNSNMVESQGKLNQLLSGFVPPFGVTQVPMMFSGSIPSL